MDLFKLRSKPGKLKTLKVFLATLAIGAIFLTSCKKELFELDKLRDPVWEPSLAIPLINSRLTTQDVLDRFDDDEIIVVDADGLLALKYFSNIFSISAEQLILLPDQSQSGAVLLSPTQINDIENGSGSATINANSNVTFTPSGSEQFTSITFKGGELKFDYNNNIPHDATIDITIPSLSNGTAFSASHFVPANAARSFNDPLAGYTLDLTGSSGTNDFDVQVTITYQDAGGTALPTDMMTTSFTMSNLQFSLIRGDLGNQTVSTDLDSVRVRIFENSTDGQIFWEDPLIRAIFTNSFGADCEVGIATLQSRSNLNPAITLTGSPFGEGSVLNINGAPSVGQSFVNTFTMSASNSNLDVIANSSPTKIIYDINVTANPGTGPFNNFMQDTSRLELDMELELPFYGTAKNFTQTDTTRFDTLQFDDVEEIQSILFRLNVDNGFPVEGYAQVYFTDSAFNRIDSLIDDPAQGIIGAGTVGAAGRVTETTKLITDIVLTREKLEKLQAAAVFDNGAIISSGRANTFNGGNTTVKIFESYYMDLRLGAKIDGKFNVPLDSLRN